MKEDRLQTLDRARLTVIERMRTERRRVLRSTATLFTSLAIVYCVGFLVVNVWIPLETMSSFQLGIWLASVGAMAALLPVVLVLTWSDWRFFQEMYEIRYGSSLRGQSPYSAWVIRFRAYFWDCRA